MGCKRPAGVAAPVPGSVFAPAPFPVPSKRPYEHSCVAPESQPKDNREGASAGPGSPSRYVSVFSFLEFNLCHIKSCFKTFSLLFRGIPAGPALPTGPAHLLNPDTVKRELHKLQHVSKKPHISR